MSSLARSPLVDASGDRLRAISWEPPAGSSPFFGWMGDDGFSTVRLEAIQAVFPQPNFPGRHIMLLRSGAQMLINAVDSERLLKRLGWKNAVDSERLLKRLGWKEPGNAARA